MARIYSVLSTCHACIYLDIPYLIIVWLSKHSASTIPVFTNDKTEICSFRRFSQGYKNNKWQS